jgi:hypothetical protein
MEMTHVIVRALVIRDCFFATPELVQAILIMYTQPHPFATDSKISAAKFPNQSQSNLAAEDKVFQNANSNQQLGALIAAKTGTLDTAAGSEVRTACQALLRHKDGQRPCNMRYIAA